MTLNDLYVKYKRLSMITAFFEKVFNATVRFMDLEYCREIIILPYFEAAGGVGSNLKSNHHKQIKVAQIHETIFIHN